MSLCWFLFLSKLLFLHVLLVSIFRIIDRDIDMCSGGTFLDDENSNDEKQA